MPEEVFVESKSSDWPKIILVAVLGLGLLVGAAYVGYWYGAQQVQQIERPTPLAPQPTTEPTPIPTRKQTTQPEVIAPINKENWVTVNEIVRNLFSVQVPWPKGCSGCFDSNKFNGVLTHGVAAIHWRLNVIVVDAASLPLRTSVMGEIPQGTFLSDIQTLDVGALKKFADPDEGVQSTLRRLPDKSLDGVRVTFYERMDDTLGQQKGVWAVAQKGENVYVIIINYDEDYAALKDEIIATFRFSPRSDTYLDCDYDTVEVSE
mgnify:CR=1 FL=1